LYSGTPGKWQLLFIFGDFKVKETRPAKKSSTSLVNLRQTSAKRMKK
jgi:hypothetical protein